MIKFIFFLSVIFINSALSCEIHLPSHILVLSQSAKISQSAAQEGCTDQEISKIDEILSAIEGSVTNFQLQELLKQKSVQAQVHPPLIKIQQVSGLIREKLSLPNGTQLTGIETSGSNGFITYSAVDKILIDCQDCSSSNRQSLTLLIQGADGSISKTPIFATLRKLTKAYRVNSFHPAFSPLEIGQLKEEYIEAVPFTDLVEDLSTLKFFRTNKPLRSGDLLRTADLKAENLVRAGVRTEVIIENEMFKLKTTGLSRSNGAWGQFVEVFHPERNKKYYGKVIDLNKVLVEL